MKPPIPTPEPIPVQTLRRYGLNATADEVAEVYRQHGELVKALESTLAANDAICALVSKAFDRFTDNDMMPPNHELSVWLSQAKHVLLKDWAEAARSILTTATQKKG